MQKLNHLFQRTENKKNCKNVVVLLTILYHWNVLLHISVLQFMFFLSMFSPHQGEFIGSQAHPVPSPFPVRSVHGQTSNNTGIYQGRVWVPDVNVREVSLFGFPMVFNLCISDFQSFAVWLDSEVYLLHFLCVLQCVSSNTHFYRDYLVCTHFWFQVLCFFQCWNVFHQNSVLISINAQSEFMSQDHSVFSVYGVMLAVWVAFSKIKCLMVYLICIW